MQDLQMWSLLVGFVLPNGIAVIQRPAWTSWLRTLVSFIVCVVVGFVTVLLQGDLSGKRLITCVLLTLVTAETTYKRFWVPLGVAPKIEQATSPNSVIVNQPDTEPTVVPETQAVAEEDIN